MRLLPSLLITCQLFCASSSVWAWGAEGHSTIGAMADQLIAGTAAAAHVHALLGDETLATASLWADQVKGRTNQTVDMLQFKSANPNHSAFHYTDVPFEETNYYDRSVGATNTDVVHAIPACILILEDRGSEQTLFKNVPPRVALRLLVHYIEDLHQPLHAGSGYLHGTNFVDPDKYSGPYKGDQGGNLLVYDQTNKLHYYWDVTVVKADMARDHVQTPEAYAAVLLKKTPPVLDDSGSVLNWDRHWANESLLLSAHVHDVKVVDEDDSETDRRSGLPRAKWDIESLTPQYVDWSDRTAEDQMQKAGYRVAETLEAIWPGKQ